VKISQIPIYSTNPVNSFTQFHCLHLFFSYPFFIKDRFAAKPLKDNIVDFRVNSRRKRGCRMPGIDFQQQKKLAPVNSQRPG
jgi:hypothetical protein